MRIDGYAGDPRDANGVLGLIVCDFKDDEEVQTINSKELPSLFNPLIRYLKKAREELIPIAIDLFSVSRREFEGDRGDMPLIAGKIAKRSGIEGVIHNAIIL